MRFKKKPNNLEALKVINVILGNAYFYKHFNCDSIFTFQYVTRSIPGPGSSLKDFKEQFLGCSCQNKCDKTSCECLLQFHESYNKETKQLLPEVIMGTRLKPIVECNSNCRCDSGCANRLVQHGPFIKLKVCKVDEKGYGLFTSEIIPQLSFVCEYAGEIIGIKEAQKRLKEAANDMNYLIVLREHCASGMRLTCVDPRHFGNVGRFLNHSCDPNLVMVPVRVENSVPRLALFARKNILAGEELTFDYSGEALFNSTSSTFQSINSAAHTENKDVPQELQCEESNHFNITQNNVYKSLKEKPVNSRKRKRLGSARGDDIHCSGRSRIIGDLDKSQVTENSSLDIPFQRKLCLCGSPVCKGYLPYSVKMFSQ